MKNKVKLWYIGKRLVNDKLRQQFFVEGKPDEIFGFKGAIKGIWTGFAYWGHGLPDKVSMPTRPERIDFDQHEDHEKWNAQERAALTIARQENVARRASKLPELLKSVEAIKKFSKGLRYDEMRALVDWLISEVQREEMERLNRDINARLEHAFKRNQKAEAATKAAEAKLKKGGK